MTLQSQFYFSNNLSTRSKSDIINIKSSTILLVVQDQFEVDVQSHFYPIIIEHFSLGYDRNKIIVQLHI
jgi:hypothetical protein